jgi:hypothetical protein
MRWALVLLTLLGLAANPLHAQDGLGPVRDLYTAADYEGALAALDRLPDATTTDDRVARDRLRAMALIALGRATAADLIIERIVTARPIDPLGDEDAAPRIRLAFDTVRRRVLPVVARAHYNAAKSAFDRRQLAEAADGFARTLTIIDVLPADAPGRDDLRTLAAGFLELARAADAAPTSAPAAEPVQETAAARPRAFPTDSASPAAAQADEAPGTPPVVAPAVPSPNESAPPAAAVAGEASNADGEAFTEAVAVFQELPPWRPARTEQRQVTFSGILEVDIDARGAVTGARMLDAAHPAYDAALLTTAMQWKYTPARRGETAVPSSKRITIALRPQ